MKYLLDTCLISELVKKEPNPAVIVWLDKQDERKLFLSVLNLGELRKGISKLPDGTKKNELQAWVDQDLVERFSGRILELNLDTSLRWGQFQGEAERLGEKLPVMDSLIAATAVAHGLVVVTRNTRDLERCGAPLFNPWEGVELPAPGI